MRPCQAHLAIAAASLTSPIRPIPLRCIVHEQVYVPPRRAVAARPILRRLDLLFLHLRRRPCRRRGRHRHRRGRHRRHGRHHRGAPAGAQGARSLQAAPAAAAGGERLLPGLSEPQPSLHPSLQARALPKHFRSVRFTSYRAPDDCSPHRHVIIAIDVVIVCRCTSAKKRRWARRPTCS